MALPSWSTASVAAAAAGMVILVGSAPLGAQVLAHNAQALANMRTQAEAGDPLAQFDLGFLYHEARGVPRNEAEAIEWYGRAAEHGFALAQLHLGILYAAGSDRRPPDDLTACMWFILAADRSRGDVRDRSIELRDTVTARMPSEQIAEAQRRAQEWDAARTQSR